MDHNDYVWNYIDGAEPIKRKIYKVWWKIAIRHSTDGYFYKAINIHDSHKYTDDYWQAKQILEKINASIQTLGLADKATTGIEEEEV